MSRELRISRVNLEMLIDEATEGKIGQWRRREW